MSAIIMVPAAAATRRATPLTKAIPMPSSPSMKVQSAQTAPAQEWNVSSSGPAETWLRKPLVGDPPSIHPLPAGVAYPQPNVLSPKAQRNVNAVSSRVAAATRATVRGVVSSSAVVPNAVAEVALRHPAKRIPG